MKFFPVGSHVRFSGEDVLGIVTRTTAERAYVEWVGFDYPPNSDGWHPHANLRPKKSAPGQTEEGKKL